MLPNAYENYVGMTKWQDKIYKRKIEAFNKGYNYDS